MGNDMATYWNREQTDADYFMVELNGKKEGPTCVEAQMGEDGAQGWVRRVWYDVFTKKDRKFYGNVFIVRIK